MPREILAAEAGFFGKLPSTGDFVARGLPPVFRRHWDAWVTAHLADRLKDGTKWPDDGLRFRLVSGSRVAAGAIVPGQDSAGRKFPLSLLLIGADLPAPEVLDSWCDAALAAAEPALRGDLDADGLLAALDEVPVPDGAGDKAPGLQLWAARQPATTCDPSAPQAAIDLAFVVSCC
jgi:type VI secretion system protein ImpM